ncbi:acyltransferase [Mitsuaria sp. WAJ17]|uniref:acyltransferase family protein n=1 Tax=Mitsuaria sp. WAJ17 TaxID=2761452 RepID=UPI0016043128|nr:acyltransferase [Mitsuaria sp. WAJ17]MBB2487059.1 acyltransferase [Mitsuaria sp. WAJ17]
MDRNPAIDTLRGLVCLLLVLYHAVGSNPLNGLRIDEGLLRWVNDALVCLRMPMFALLAGMSFAQSRSRTLAQATFLRQKTVQLLLPVLTVGTLFALLQQAVPQTHGQPVLSPWMHLEPVAHFWFIQSLFWVLLVLHALQALDLVQRPGCQLAVVAALSALSLLWHAPRWLGLDGALYLLPYALVGQALANPGARQALQAPWNGPLLALGVLAGGVWLWPPVPDPDRRTLAMLLLGLALCLLLVRWSPQQPALARIGRHAMPIYLFHAFFTAATRIVVGGGLGLPTPLLLPLILAAGIAGPLLLERGIARLPWLRLALLGQGRMPASRPPRQGALP